MFQNKNLEHRFVREFQMTRPRFIHLTIHNAISSTSFRQSISYSQLQKAGSFIRQFFRGAEGSLLSLSTLQPPGTNYRTLRQIRRWHWEISCIFSSSGSLCDVWKAVPAQTKTCASLFSLSVASTKTRLCDDRKKMKKWKHYYWHCGYNDKTIMVQENLSKADAKQERHS